MTDDREAARNPSVYIGTSVISYLTARPSRDVVVAAYQEITREWWRGARDRFALFVSELVVAEAGTGDPDAARARLEIIETLPRLGAAAKATELARHLLDLGAVPREAGDDAAHIAIAVTNGVDFLVTWNFRHIANASMRPASRTHAGDRATPLQSSACRTNSRRLPHEGDEDRSNHRRTPNRQPGSRCRPRMR